MLSERLRIARKNKQLTQEQLAEKVHTKKQTISNYETGYSSPSNEMLSEIADILSVSTDYLLGRTSNPNTHKFEPMSEINRLLDEYCIEQSGLYDIDRWKAMGPEEMKELENYFKYITDQAKKKTDKNDANKNT
ncbi:Transcriptional regulator, contains XRE-family HTH domain [Pelagirhabdus alkalitolerans]|uniref:Transcriptional regulator, contains XRE-family HTH domain n=1 Tax=Pelagirhabdus alkalitolerans TaxID=1612202 RepID=A0A1G6GNR1_9BACI|nr:helix-turn-helix transcriptional regulator [Pelagirhabdus alkalitolerans]SDB83642.1 Transcriptional regulator, contains XRE-family HTH domain [Pelagirhabdus alkalitolerans]